MPSTSQAAWTCARRTADKREPCSNTRTSTCHSASWAANPAPRAWSMPRRRAVSATVQTAPRERFKDNAEQAGKVYEGINPLTAEDIAEILVWVASRPPHVNIGE